MDNNEIQKKESLQNIAEELLFAVETVKKQFNILRVFILLTAVLSLVSIIVSLLSPEIEFDFCLLFPQIIEEVGQMIVNVNNNYFLVYIAIGIKIFYILAFVFIYFHSAVYIWPLWVALGFYILDCLFLLMLDLSTMSSFLTIVGFHILGLAALTYLLVTAYRFRHLCWLYSAHYAKED